LTAGSRKLADYVSRKAPAGRIALVGFSLGGLLAREAIATKLIDASRVDALETLGTPSLGYPYAGVDVLGFCPALIEGMNGNWRVWQDRNEVQLSPYLEDLRTAWNQGSFPGATSRWLAASGRSCANAVRALNPSTGCRDANPFSDGVVCEDSAIYQTAAPMPTKPTDYWQDPDRQYVHTTSGGGLFAGTILCANSGRNPTLVDPPPGGTLFAAIRDVLEGRLVRSSGPSTDVLALTAEQQAAYVREAVTRATEGDDGLIRLLVDRSEVTVPVLVGVIRQARSRAEAEAAAELIAVAGNERARDALRGLAAENPSWFGSALRRVEQHRTHFPGKAR
jgi:type II secretory pathway pseudopilin PulG